MYTWHAAPPVPYHLGMQYSSTKVEEKVFTKYSRKTRFREDKLCKVGSARDSDDFIEVEAIIDSGSIDTITPMSMVDKGMIKQTEISRKRGKYSAANGGQIQNMGECEIEGIGEDGTKVKMISQVGDKITGMLIAVRRMVESGNMVIFGANYAIILFKNRFNILIDFYRFILVQ